MKGAAKAVLGGATRLVNRQCQFDRTLLILAHMRCGSTALSNILCSRDEISGYGETHIRYRSSDDLGRLVVNQAIRKAWKPKADFLFDKLLHNRHDDGVPPAFFQSRAIFLCRHPEDSIRSIRKLFTSLKRHQYATDELAAEYYVERVNRLAELWHLFPPDRRIGLDYATLLSDTNACLDRLTAFVGLSPDLTNSYESHSASVQGGGGDPTVSAKLNHIAKNVNRTTSQHDAQEIDSELREQIFTAYNRFVDMIASDDQTDVGTGRQA